MGEPFSLTIEKSLIQRLQPLLCCSDSLSTCQENDFCSSSPSEWPILKNGKMMVRLSYPENDDSVPGMKYFADAYIRWHSKSGCGYLAKDIAKTISSKDPLIFGNQTATADNLHSILVKSKMVNQCTKDLHEAQHKLTHISASLYDRCEIMFDKAKDKDKPVFRGDRADDLDELAAFSQKVKDAEAGKMKWGDFFWGGGALGILLFGLWVFYKLVKIVKSGSDKLEGFGTVLGSIGTNLNLISRGIRKLFGVHLINFGRVMKYVFTAGWFRGKNMPELIKADDPPKEASKQPTPNTQDTDPASKPTVEIKGIEPHVDVVLAQLSALEGSRHHATEGERFARLSNTARKYLASLAIKRWHDETVERRKYFIADDNGLTEGKLPTTFMLAFVRHFLKRDSNLDIIEASARVWARNIESPREIRTEPATHSEFKPRLIDVKRQLITDPKFARATAETRDYVANMAIAEWQNMSPSHKPLLISLSDEPETGALPRKFIRLFRKKTLRDIKSIEIRAMLYSELKDRIPILSSMPFYIIDMRLESVHRLWNWLPIAIRMKFSEADGTKEQTTKDAVPLNFADYLFKFLSFNSALRPAINPSVEPWHYGRNPDLVYKGYSLSRVMERLGVLTEKFRDYPLILKTRARAVVEAWLLLDEKIKSEFVSQDDTHEMTSRYELARGVDAIPRIFVNFIHELSSGIGTIPRKAAIKSDNPDDDGGEGKGGAGGLGGSGSLMPPTGTPSSAPPSQVTAAIASNRIANSLSLQTYAPVNHAGLAHHYNPTTTYMSQLIKGVAANTNAVMMMISLTPMTVPRRELSIPAYQPPMMPSMMMSGIRMVSGY